MNIHLRVDYHTEHLEMVDYQTEHLSLGFMLEPLGQLQAAAKSGLLDRGPSTRNLPEKYV